MADFTASVGQEITQIIGINKKVIFFNNKRAILLTSCYLLVNRYYQNIIAGTISYFVMLYMLAIYIYSSVS